MGLILPAIFILVFVLIVAALTKKLGVNSLKCPVRELASFIAFVGAILALGGSFVTAQWVLVTWLS